MKKEVSVPMKRSPAESVTICVFACPDDSYRAYLSEVAADVVEAMRIRCSEEGLVSERQEEDLDAPPSLAIGSTKIEIVTIRAEDHKDRKVGANSLFIRACLMSSTVATPAGTSDAEAAHASIPYASPPSQYDLRFIVSTSAADQEPSHRLNAIMSLSSTIFELLFRSSRRRIPFISTRGMQKGTSGRTVGFLEAVRQGLAPDGGLFLPWPNAILPFSAADLQFLVANNARDGNHYHQTAQFVLERLIGPPSWGAQLPVIDDPTSTLDETLPVPTPAEIGDLLTAAYHPSRWNNLVESISPLTPLFPRGVSNAATAEISSAIPSIFAKASTATGVGLHVLEQYHGPTAAFKDFALQLFPCFFRLATQDDPYQYLILAATSGDTGVAAINGFLQNGGPLTKVMVLFPEKGVSPVQKAQMLSYSDGKRVQVVGLHADFDFCQSTVKHVFADADVRAQLSQLGPRPVVLSSANSINWGRLLPQIVYYVHAYVDLVRRDELAMPSPPTGGAAEKSLATAFDVVVPTGNFGNILSCFVAKKLGIPVRRFVLASNENDVLHQFISTGTYDIRAKKLVKTSSPSIDILKASNIERFLFFIYDGNTDRVRAHMEALETEGIFTVDADVFAREVQPVFWSASCDQPHSAAVTAAVYEASNGSRLLDPHTAVAVAVLEAYLAHLRQIGADTVPIIVASTAHWGKFPEPVMQALGVPVEAAAPVGMIGGLSPTATSVQSMHADVQLTCPDVQPVPVSLVEAIRCPEKKAPLVIERPTYDAVVKELLHFASN